MATRIDSDHGETFASKTGRHVPPTGLRVTVSPIKGVTPPRVFAHHGPLVFPAVLNTLEIAEPATFQDFDSVGAGSFSVRRGGDETARELRAFSLEVYATDLRNLPFLQLDAPDTWATVRDRVRAIFRARYPVHLEAAVVKRVETHPPNPFPGSRPSHNPMYLFQEFEEVQDFTGAVTFRNFTQRLSPGEPESRYFTIECKDWRDLAAATARTKYGWNLPVRRTVDKNDTLWSLAKFYYGHGSKYKLIQAHTKALRKIPAHSKLHDHKIKSVYIPKPGD